MKFGIAAVLLVLAAGLQLLSPGFASVRADPGGFIATPGELTLAPDESASGLVEISNPGAVSTRVRLMARPSNDSVRVELPNPELVIEAGRAAVIGFTATRIREGSGNDVTIAFIVEKTPVSGAAGAGPDITVGKVLVTSSAAPALVELSILAADLTVNENRTATALVKIVNQRNDAIELTSLSITAPNSVTLTVQCPGGQTVLAVERQRGTGCSYTMLPREEVLLPVQIDAMRAVVPGPRAAVVEAEVRNPGTPKPHRLAATIPFTVEVFGESDILQVVGVPTLLLAPGLIVLLTFWFLLRLAGIGAGVQKELATESTIANVGLTAVAGVFLSLVMAKVYPTITQWLPPGERRDYLKSYGFNDIFLVFTYSFAIATLLWVAAVAVSRVWHWAAVPAERDDPRTLLRKLALRDLAGFRSTFPKVMYDGRGALLIADSAEDTVLIAPRIRLSASSELLESVENWVVDGRTCRIWQKIWRSSEARLSWVAGDVGEVEVVPRPEVGDPGQTVSAIQSS
ncbi:hypothetical protein [Nocardia sp. NPDC057353]|uniref:hypothetical protein n=1 Tax=Nocardia sp. NPDC057353 TaxID=3346104 RepID=UPI00362DD46F